MIDLCAEEGRSHHPSKTLIGHPFLQLPRAVAARVRREKIRNSQSLRPEPVRGVGVRLPPPTDAETRDLKLGPRGAVGYMPYWD